MLEPLYVESSLCLVYKCSHGGVEQDDGDMEQIKLVWFDKFLFKQSYIYIYIYLNRYIYILCIVQDFYQAVRENCIALTLL